MASEREQRTLVGTGEELCQALSPTDRKATGGHPGTECYYRTIFNSINVAVSVEIGCFDSGDNPLSPRVYDKSKGVH